MARRNDWHRQLTRQARQRIFQASDSDGDGIVSEEECIENQIITDEAKVIFDEMDANNDGKLTKDEFVANGKIKDEDLAKTVLRHWIQMATANSWSRSIFGPGDVGRKTDAKLRSMQTNQLRAVPALPSSEHSTRGHDTVATSTCSSLSGNELNHRIPRA